MSYNQIDISGRIVTGPETSDPRPNRIKELIFNELNLGEYKFEWVQTKKQPYSAIFFDGTKNIDIYIYAWRITNGGKGRNRPSEKRIEIYEKVDNIGFFRPITDTEKTILIGIYENQPTQPIYAAWSVSSNRTHTQKSCQVQVEDLAKALSEEIYETKDSRNNSIFTFTNEYLGKYIELVKDDGNVAIDLSIPITMPFKSKIAGSILFRKKSKEKTSIEELLTKAAGLTETEKEAVIKTRIGQGLFKKLLVEKYKEKCCICGLSCRSLLIGSHIKAWSQSENEERLDVNNGLLLCTSHDALFDKYFISFDETGKIVISSALQTDDKNILGLSDSIKIDVTDEMKPYLEWHRSKLI